VINHVKFQENIYICSAKGFIEMTGNSSRKHMSNNIIDFSYLKLLFYITTLLERNISYFGYLGISSCQSSESQH